MKLEALSSPDGMLNAASTSQNSAPERFGPRIEPCQFEQLLQRAMEVLNQRHLEAQLNVASDTRS